MKKIRGVAVLFFASCLFFSHATPGYSLIEKPTEDSMSVKDFSLLDHKGMFHRLYYYSDQKAVVLISQGNGCPIVRQEIPYLRRLQRAYQRKNTVFLMINANPQDDRRSIFEEAEQYGITIPILEDRAQTVAESLNLTRTAEAIVIDPSNWTIVYRGAVTDRFGYETQRKKTGRHYLRDAIEALLARRPVVISKTPVKGCLINLKGVSFPQSPTYTKDVAPVLEKHCITCHTAKGSAPWNMTDYKTVKGWAPMMREVIQTKRMPPWGADPHYGEFKNDVSLSPEETRTIIRWIDQGCPRGQGDDPLTKPKPEKSEWALGKPDLIFSSKERQSIPAVGEVYRTVTPDSPAEEDMWIQAVDLRPGNVKTVHHGIVGLFEPGELPSRALMMLRLDETGLIGGYSPGGNPWQWPDDAGIFISKGSKLSMHMHYVGTGKPEYDNTRLGLYLRKQKPPKIGFVKDAIVSGFNIPAGEKNYKIAASCVFTTDATLIALKPHMHHRGKNMRVTAHYPDGTSEVLLSVPNYKFRWQYRYELKNPKKIPAGTKIIAEGAFDNSAQNPENPDPSKDVSSGFSSYAEMFAVRLWCTRSHQTKLDPAAERLYKTLLARQTKSKQG